MGHWEMDLGYTARVIRRNEYDEQRLPLRSIEQTVAATTVFEVFLPP